MNHLIRASVPFFVSCALIIGLCQPSYAAVITVNTTTDVTADDGSCSLVEAVEAANTDTASGSTTGECRAGVGTDSITIPAGLYCLSDTLTLSSNLTLTGDAAGGTILDAGYDAGCTLSNTSVIQISPPPNWHFIKHS